jgi:hypothetical protein
MTTRHLLHELIGTRVQLPEEFLMEYPELAEVRWRRGGMPPRIGGWPLGQRTVSAITLWRTVWLADDVPWDAGLLLHELRHVHQFQASLTFPLRYLWESVRRGYHHNRFEVDARQFARRRLRAVPTTPPTEDV